MGAEIGSINIALSADLQKLIGDFNKAGSATDAFGRKAERSATQAESSLGKALGVLRLRAETSTASLGLLGTGLGALGPAGLAAGLGIGVLGVAFTKAAGAAGVFGDEMRKMRDVAQSLDLTASQLQAINDLGAKFSLPEDKIGTMLQRFVSGMDELRRGSGDLFEIIQRIDPALARELAGVKDTAGALDILAQAYARAGTERRAALSKAVAGKGGQDFGLLLNEIKTSGGIAALTAEFVKSGDAIENQVIKNVARLKTEIDDMSGDARRNFASIFSERILEIQHQQTQRLLELSRAAKTFEISDDLRKLITPATNAIPSWLSNLSVWGSLGPLLKMAPQLQVGTLPTGSTNSAGDLRSRGLADLARGRGTPLSQNADEMYSLFAPKQANKTSAEFELNVMTRYIALLGAAATPAEQLKLKKLELAAAAEKYGLSETIIARALGATTYAQQQAAVAARATLGLASEQEMRTLALAQIKDMEVRGYIKGEQEKTAATRLLMDQARAAYEQAQIAASATPQLTRLSMESQNLRTQLDTGFTEAIRGIGSEFSLLNPSVDTFSQRLKNMGLRMADVVVQAMIMKNVLGPVANLFSGGLTSLFSGGGGSTGFTGGLSGLWHTGGKVGAGTAPSYRADTFIGAVPKFHSGLTSREFRAVLEQGEHVLTAQQASSTSGTIAGLTARVGNGGPQIKIYPVAGTTMDKNVLPDGSIELVGRMIDDKLKNYNSNVLPDRVQQLNADPRRRF